MRYFGVLFLGGLFLFGGVIIFVIYFGEFNGSVVGIGFLVLVVLIFG